MINREYFCDTKIDIYIYSIAGINRDSELCSEMKYKRSQTRKCFDEQEEVMNTIHSSFHIKLYKSLIYHCYYIIIDDYVYYYNPKPILANYMRKINNESDSLFSTVLDWICITEKEYKKYLIIPESLISLIESYINPFHYSLNGINYITEKK